MIDDPNVKRFDSIPFGQRFVDTTPPYGCHTRKTEHTAIDENGVEHEFAAGHPVKLPADF